MLEIDRFKKTTETDTADRTDSLAAPAHRQMISRDTLVPSPLSLPSKPSSNAEPTCLMSGSPLFIPFMAE